MGSFLRDGPSKNQKLLFAVLWVLLIGGLFIFMLLKFIQKANDLPAELKKTAIEISKSLPIEIEKGVSIVGASSNGKLLQLTVSLSDPLDTELEQLYSEAASPGELADMCSTEDLTGLFILGGQLEYLYYSASGNLLSSTVLDKEVCGVD